MNQRILVLTAVVILYVSAFCRSESPEPEQDLGYMRLNVGLEMEIISIGGVEAVSTDDFLVAHNVIDGSEIFRFNTNLEVPHEAQLPASVPGLALVYDFDGSRSANRRLLDSRLGFSIRCLKDQKHQLS